MPAWAYPIVYHRRKIVFGVIFALFFFLFFSLAFCDYTEATGMLKGVLDDIDEIFGSDSLSSTKDLLKIIQSGTTIKIGSYDMSAVYQLMKSLSGIFMNIGTCLLLIYWMMGFFDMLMANNNQMIMEQMIRKFIYLMIGIALVTNAFDVVMTITNIGSEILDNVFNKMSNTSSTDIQSIIVDVKNNIYDDCTTAANTSGLIAGLAAKITDDMSIISYKLKFFIPWLFCKICNVLVSVACWSRFIEICIMAVISPVMFSDVTSEQGGFMRTTSARAIKTILSLALSGVLILISLYICNFIAMALIDPTAGTSGIGDFAFSMVIVGIVRVGLVSKASQLSKQMLGLV
jgi:hypothetical protein